MATERSSTSRPTGIIIAPAAPCAKRAATIAGRPGANPHAIELATNNAIAVWNTVRAPNRSATVAEAGMKMASASR